MERYEFTFPSADGVTAIHAVEWVPEGPVRAVLVVSQFTLYADCRRGRRPSFTGAGDPEAANELYEQFVSLARRDVEHVETGSFGADMEIELVNDGPFTIVLDTVDLAR